MAEILNNEAGGTGCGMDALAIWTSTRGKCAEGEFMSLAGASYNAVPVPLGVGLPACTQTTEKKSTRCCGDDVVVESACPSSTATCQELLWPLVAADASGEAFCPQNEVYNCVDGPRGCYEQFARPCTASELTRATASMSGLLDSTVAQLQSTSSHGPTDQCMCCADDNVMSEPCTRPSPIATTSTEKQLVFAVDTAETRQCYWVFDGCPAGQGVELKFVQADVADGIPGDGWRIFGAASPIDLVSVENMEYSRASILAEIHSTDARTFPRTTVDDGTRMKTNTGETTGHGQAPLPRSENTEYTVRSPHGAILELKAAGAAVKGAATAAFAVLYKCAPVVGGCMDTAANNYSIEASHDDGSCEYPPSVSTGPHGELSQCVSNPRRIGDEYDECACVVTRQRELMPDDVDVLRSSDPFDALLAPYQSESCSIPSTSTDFVSQVIAGDGGLYWLRFSGTTFESSTQLLVNDETVIVEGITSDPLAQSLLPELNMRITARDDARVFVRQVAIRNKVAVGNAAVASIHTDSVLIMADVLMENNIATGFHGAIFCDSETKCDFLRVAFIGNAANENGALGGWGSIRLRAAEFRNNWALRGGGLFQQRAKRSTPQSCSTQADCAWLDDCFEGFCEPSITVSDSVFTANVATGDCGGVLVKGSAGFDIATTVEGTAMQNNYAPLYGTVVASLSNDVEQSRSFHMHNCSISRSPLGGDKSAIALQDITDWKLHSVDFAGFTPGLVAANTKAIDCFSAAMPPCPGGFSCVTLNESIHCEHCDPGLVSAGRGSCELCSPGTGPTPEQDGCEPCTGNDYSPAGICRPCPRTLVVADSLESCVGCPEYQTAVNGTTQANASHAASRVCGCQRGYVNASKTLHVCHKGGFALKSEGDALHRLQGNPNECMLCPHEQPVGETCLVCSAGGAHIAPGFAVFENPAARQATATTDGRRRQQILASKGPVTVSIFRCHPDLEVARNRCPGCASPPCTCSPGYEGFFCGSCEKPSKLHPAGFGMDGVSGVCVECEGRGSFTVMLLIAVACTACLGIVLWFFARAWRTRRIEPIRHLVKTGITPAKTLCVYFQVMSQLGQVLEFTWPGLFGKLIATIKPLFEWWRGVFFFIGPGECYGLRDYRSWWMMKVFGMLGALSALIFCNYLSDVRKDARDKSGSKDTLSPGAKAMSHASLAVFFCYPGTCQLAFEVLLCRQVSEDESVFELDDRVLCSSDSHQVMTYFAYALIGVCVMLPTYALLVLEGARRNYQAEMVGDIRERRGETAKKAAQAAGVSLNVAKWVVTEVMIGTRNQKGWQTLTDGYKPQYMFWEAFDMYRKLLLVGVVLLVRRGSISQIVIASTIAFSFLVAHMFTWPYKSRLDNIFRATTEAHVFVTVYLALVLQYDLSYEGNAKTTYEHVMFWSFILFVPIAFLATIALKLRQLRRELNETNQGEDGLQAANALTARLHAFHLCRFGLADHAQRNLLERWFQGWSTKGKHAAFISHYKAQAAPEARILKDQMFRCLHPASEDDIFLDSDNLTDLRTLRDSVEQSDAVIVLYTKTYLSRPFCLVELQTAVRAKVPLIVLSFADRWSPHYADSSEIANILDDLPGWLQDNTHSGPGEYEALDRDLQKEGVNLASLGGELKETLVAATTDKRGEPRIPLNTHGSRAQLESQMGSLACAFVEEGISPENDPLVNLETQQLVELMAQRDVGEQWAVERKFALYIVHQERNAEAVGRAAAGVRQWLVDNTGLGVAQVRLASEDAATEAAAEMKPPPLAVGEDGGEPLDNMFSKMTQEADCVLLLQSPGALLEPRFIATAYAAILYKVPICCGFFTTTSNESHEHKFAYSFIQANDVLQTLSSALDHDDLQDLQTLIGPSLLVDEVGSQLQKVLPKIISKPIGLPSPNGAGALTATRLVTSSHYSLLSRQQFSCSC